MFRHIETERKMEIKAKYHRAVKGITFKDEFQMIRKKIYFESLSEPKILKSVVKLFGPEFFFSDARSF